MGRFNRQTRALQLIRPVSLLIFASPLTNQARRGSLVIKTTDKRAGKGFNTFRLALVKACCSREKI